MGAVNYGTSDYITIGYEPQSAYELENDSGFMEEIQAQVDEYGGTIADAIQDYINDDMEDMLINIQHILNKYSFSCFTVSIEHGYYEGFYINIKSNFVYYDDSAEKRIAQKEATQIKAFLIECVNVGLVEVWPGWCTSYKTYGESITGIKAAIKEMRTEIKNTPTYRNFNFKEVI